MSQAGWRYYLSNHKCTDKNLPCYIRNHWGIENKLHWILDVHLKEDDDQKSERKSARSFALLKRIVLNIVRTKDTTPKKVCGGSLSIQHGTIITCFLCLANNTKLKF